MCVWLFLLKQSQKKFKELLDHFDSISHAQQNRLLRSPVPDELRGELWMKISGAQDLLKKNAGVYDMLVTRGRCAPGDEEKIVKDIARTFPDVQSNPRLQTHLFNVLKAYSVFDPDLGYCQVQIGPFMLFSPKVFFVQGLNFVCATLLTHLNSEESFWLFVTLLKGRYEMRSYFAAGVPELVVNLYCLDRFIEL